ncbi:MAG: carbon-nitrogen hydrolase family protein [Armatimonadetes bacterium]|nr:carbon-nitrogen hydrolase family protein [Armatimonadota bacterium]
MRSRSLLMLAAALVLTITALCSPAWATESTVPTTSRNKLRLGLVRTVKSQWKLDHNFDVFLAILDKASKKGVELLTTCECFLDGYSASNKESTRQRLLDEVAQDTQSSRYLARVAEEAKQRNMSIVFGFTEKRDGKLYNAAGFWDAQGRLVGVYHKVHLQIHDKQFDSGESIPVFNSPWGPLGIMICADRRWPETARTLRLKGARIILNPTYGMTGELNECLMRTRAWENNCFVAFCHPNQSLVTNPGGAVIARMDDGDDLLVVDIDLSQTDAASDSTSCNIGDRHPELYGIISEREKK